jgi:hypothetical protein
MSIDGNEEALKDAKRFKNDVEDGVCGDGDKRAGGVCERKEENGIRECELGGDKDVDKESKEEPASREEDHAAVSTMFGAQIPPEGFKPDRNIFQSPIAAKKQTKESGFLTMSLQKSTQPAKDEIRDVIFKANATLHKFISEWENIGAGALYITVFAGEKRCFFIRDGVMLTAFDFLAKYDLMPKKKKLGVTINVKEVVDEKLAGQIYCLVFQSEQAAEEFVEHIKV